MVDWKRGSGMIEWDGWEARPRLTFLGNIALGHSLPPSDTGTFG